MSLTDQLEAEGRWLFRWRSYLPLVFLPLIVVALITDRWPFGSLAFHEVWEMGCLAVSFTGLAVRVMVVGYAPLNTSGRNTKRQLADSLNTTGIYSVVRHPLYLGNFLIGLGVVLVPFVWWLPTIYVTTFWLYYERIMMAEEAFLAEQFCEEYRRWAASTPTFVPALRRWRRNKQSFSFRTVLRAEHSALLVIGALHAGIETLEHIFIEHRVPFELFWELLLGSSIVLYVALRTLKIRSGILDVPGRSPVR